MNALVAEIIAGIEKHDEEAFLGAAMVAEFATGHTHPVPPYGEKLQADPPSNADVQAMRKALLQYAQSGASRSYAALNVLSKFRDSSLVPLLRPWADKVRRVKTTGVIFCSIGVLSILFSLVR